MPSSCLIIELYGNYGSEIAQNFEKTLNVCYRGYASYCVEYNSCWGNKFLSATLVVTALVAVSLELKCIYFRYLFHSK